MIAIMQVLRKTLTVLERIDEAGDGDGNVSPEEVDEYLKTQGTNGAFADDIKRKAAAHSLEEIRGELADVQARLAVKREETVCKAAEAKAKDHGGVKIGPCEFGPGAIDVARFLTDPTAGYVCQPCATCSSSAVLDHGTTGGTSQNTAPD